MSGTAQTTPRKTGPAADELAPIRAMVRRADLKTAETELQKVLERNPRNAGAQLLLGVVREHQGRFTESESLFRSALQLNPKLLSGYEKLAELCTAQQRLDDAAAVRKAAVDALPASAAAKAALAEAYTKVGRYQEALGIANQVQPAAERHLILPALVAAHIGQQNAEELHKSIGEVLQLAPSHPDLAPRVAETFLKAGMAGDALQFLDITLKRQPPKASLLAVLSQAQGMAGQREQAKETAERALKLDPQSPDALRQSGRIAMAAGDWAKAEQQLVSVLAQEPLDVEVMRMLVVAQLQTKRIVDAYGVARRWYRLRPTDKESALAYGIVLVEGIHYGEAEPVLKKVLAQSPDDKRALLAIGIAQYYLSKPEEATASLRASLGQKGGDGTAHYYLGLVAKQQANVAQAIREMELAVAADPNKGEAFGSLGQLYMQVSEFEKARVALERAVEVLPEDPANHYQLAMAYTKLGQKDKARERLNIYRKLEVRQGSQPNKDGQPGENPQPPRG